VSACETPKVTWSRAACALPPPLPPAPPGLQGSKGGMAGTANKLPLTPAIAPSRGADFQYNPLSEARKAREDAVESTMPLEMMSVRHSVFLLATSGEPSRNRRESGTSS
jgi:hypothetical protein